MFPFCLTIHRPPNRVLLGYCVTWKIKHKIVNTQKQRVDENTQIMSITYGTSLMVEQMMKTIITAWKAKAGMVHSLADTQDVQVKPQTY